MSGVKQSNDKDACGGENGEGVEAVVVVGGKERKKSEKNYKSINLIT